MNSKWSAFLTVYHFASGNRWIKKDPNNVGKRLLEWFAYLPSHYKQAMDSAYRG